MNFTPNISCSLIIATYNWPQALELSLQSALQQSLPPNEILIADDGSKEDTRTLIEEFKKKTSIPIHHVWHADTGFRLGEIRNKAIAQASCDYIIQIDGDIIMEPHFIEDHIALAAPNYFLCGSRVKLSKSVSNRFFSLPGKTPSLKHLPWAFVLNGLRIPVLARLLADRYKRKQVEKLRGCNMSFWRKDLLAVNGYNEDIVGWGPEDSELAIRLINLGIKKRFIKFSGIAFHLYHLENSRQNYKRNREILDQTIATNRQWAHNGITKGVNNKQCKQK